MSLKELHQRYLIIAKNSLSFLKEKGFQKKGMKYIKQNGELILEVSSLIRQPAYNSEDCYDFSIGFNLYTTHPYYLQVYSLLEGGKNLQKAEIISKSLATYEGRASYLTINDPPGRDEELARGFQEKIARDIVPWFETVSTLADMTKLAEEEYKKEDKEKFFFTMNVYRSLIKLYAAQGLRNKALAMCDESILVTPETSRYLAEKEKQKILKYLEEREKSP